MSEDEPKRSWNVFSRGFAVVDHSTDIVEFYTFMAFVQNVEKRYIVCRGLRDSSSIARNQPDRTSPF